MDRGLLEVENGEEDDNLGEESPEFIGNRNMKPLVKAVVIFQNREIFFEKESWKLNKIW